MQSCTLTPEKNPVCGTDGVTYSNPGMLLCTQLCGIDVIVGNFGPCWNNPIPNPLPFVCPTLPPPTKVPTNPTTTQDCINKCPFSPEMKPVCGTDGVTYNNLGSLQCRMKCGVDVKLNSESSCTTSPNIDGHKDETTMADDNGIGSTINAPIQARKNSIKYAKQDLKTKIPAERECIKVLLSGSSYLALPAQILNTPFVLDHHFPVTRNIPSGGICPPKPGFIPETVGYSQLQYARCRGRQAGSDAAEAGPSCTLTPEKNPVCGTDGVTYSNPGMLLCTQFCGIDVSIFKLSACGQTTNKPTEQTPPVRENTERPIQSTVATPSTPAPSDLCIYYCVVPPEDDKPVCGTDGKTYASMQRLNCAKTCGISFTIPPAILSKVFNKPTKFPDIDKRMNFGDGSTETSTPKVQSEQNRFVVAQE
ncbi:Kazal-type serine protease inhibitor domain-containing protein [Operophtera brumata]|uniref:Kazal-type serine protease inhibitor domain-containing protein n=1 Tax=Operophtera brumata TaxID=104452 RepID=A0A0L7L278_OPEBR|nr:Kazal-type serine protease inhibitor domain-containing protein [Operophtera brumata]